MIDEHYWLCVGIPPRIPPCGADGGNDRDAERHTKTTGHSTTSGTRSRPSTVERKPA